jgi:predicted alpha/beta-fold hydrolase
MWSIEDYCASQTPWQISTTIPHISSQTFLTSLQLPTVHPFCTTFAANYSAYYLPNIPRQGPLLHWEHLETLQDVIWTITAQVVPSLWAMMELWFRLFAYFVAPVGLLYLLQRELLPTFTTTKYNTLLYVWTVISAMVLWTDELYCLEMGPRYGATTFVAVVFLVWRSTSNRFLRCTLLGSVLITLFLVYDSTMVAPQFEEGLYYDTVRGTPIVQQWPEPYRKYTPATPWMPTGDARTGLPFLLNRAPLIVWHRLWLPVHDDDGVEQEVVALDIAFPPHGHDVTKPVYLLLHGLNGGSQEPYVREMAGRRLAENSTVVVLVARGLMDLPVRGWNVFHGARWTDVHTAAKVLQTALAPNQLLVGVGYSMGGIILSNYVARSGTECGLHAAVAISGGLDMRVEAEPNRANRLWQPIVAVELRDTFVVGKWGERVRSRLSKTQMKALMRATNIAGIDRTAVVAYNGFRDLMVRIAKACESGLFKTFSLSIFLSALLQ